MRIKRLHIKNYRAFADEVIELGDYNCFVGMNGAGKSTVLCALNVFFQEKSNSTDVQKLSEEDFHKKNVKEPIELTVAFRDLSEEAKNTLSDYVRNDELIVIAVATYDPAISGAKVKQFGVRMGISRFAPYFKSLGDKLSAKELKAIYDGLRVDFRELPEKTSSTDARTQALREYEAARQDLHEPQRSQDEFYGISGSSKLRPYVQWVYIPAVKDAADEQVEGRDTAFGRLLARTVRQRVNFKQEVEQIELAARNSICELMNKNLIELGAIGRSLTRRLSEWSHPDASIEVAWDDAPVTVREPTARAYGAEGGFTGNLSRFGHGFQRAYLLALLQEVATSDDEDGPTLILGCEEPELYQHPPQARHLSGLLRELSTANAQILVSTHSPYFVSAEAFEDVRVVRKDLQGVSTVCSLSYEMFANAYAAARLERLARPAAIMAQLGECLRPHLNEMFFARKLVIVEGGEDAAYILSWAVMSAQLSSLRKQGVHVVAVDGKSNILRPLLVAQGLGIPVFVVFDSDGGVEGERRALHEKDNSAILRALGVDPSNTFPLEVTRGSNYTQWPRDLGAQVKQDLQDTLEADLLAKIYEEARCDCGQAKSLEKNNMFIQSLVRRAYERGGRSASLMQLCNQLVSDEW